MLKFLKDRWKVLLLLAVALEIFLRLSLGNLGFANLEDSHPKDGRCVGLKAGTSTIYTGYLMKIPPVRMSVNRLGYRGKAHPQRKGKGIYRIAVIGDSFTFGQGVEDGKTIPGFLETELRHRTKKKIEVLNFGMPGYNLEDEVDQLKFFALKWDPDLVLVLLFADDLFTPFCQSSQNVIVGVFLRYVYITRALYLSFRIFGILGYRIWLQLSKISHRGVPAKVARMRMRLRKGIAIMKQLSKQRGAELGIVVIGNPLSSPEPKELDTIFSELNLSWLNGEAWTSRSSSRALPTIPREGHFTAEGNRRAAQEIAVWMGKVGWLHKKG